MVIVLVVPDPPPIRTTPLRAADQRSPNAEPLVMAARSLLHATPGQFPLTFESILVTFGRTLPDTDGLGYQPEQPIYEVLVDAGVLVEPEGWSMNHSHQPLADFYVVRLVVEAS